MKSLRELYRIGKGPSSSHTMELDMPHIYRETAEGGLAKFYK